MRAFVLLTIFAVVLSGCSDSASPPPKPGGSYFSKETGKFCKVVNASKKEALAVTSVAAGLVGGATTTASAAGVSAVVHSSGAVILSGSAGYIAGTLGTAGAATVGVLTAPATLAATAVSLVALGGAVYICQ